MNKSFERALIGNILIILLFIFSQYIMWTQLLYTHDDFGSGGISIASLWLKGFYGVIGVGNSLEVQSANHTEIFGQTNYYANYELSVFVLAIALNLYLMHGMGKEEKRHSPPPQPPKA